MVGVGLFILLRGATERLWALVRSAGWVDWHLGYGSYRFLSVSSDPFGIRTSWGGRTPRTEPNQQTIGRTKVRDYRRQVRSRGHLRFEAQRWELTRQLAQRMAGSGSGTPRGHGIGEGPDRYATPASQMGAVPGRDENRGEALTAAGAGSDLNVREEVELELSHMVEPSFMVHWPCGLEYKDFQSRCKANIGAREVPKEGVRAVLAGVCPCGGVAEGSG